MSLGTNAVGPVTVESIPIIGFPGPIVEPCPFFATTLKRAFPCVHARCLRRSLPPRRGFTRWAGPGDTQHEGRQAVATLTTSVRKHTITRQRGGRRRCSWIPAGSCKHNGFRRNDNRGRVPPLFNHRFEFPQRRREVACKNCWHLLHG